MVAFLGRLDHFLLRLNFNSRPIGFGVGLYCKEFAASAIANDVGQYLAWFPQ